MRHGHINLVVADLERSVRFYGEHFGFHRAGDHDGIVVLQDADGYDLVLEQGDPTPGTFHFGFRSPRSTDVDDARRSFEAAGVEMFALNEGGLPSFKIHDPDRYTIEVYSYPDVTSG